MPDDELDPGAPTEMFQAFVDRPEPEVQRTRWPWALAVAGLAIVVVVAWLVVGG